MTDRTQRLLEQAVHRRTMRGVEPRLLKAMDRHQSQIEEDEGLPKYVRIQMRDLYAMTQILYKEVKRLSADLEHARKDRETRPEVVYEVEL